MSIQLLKAFGFGIDCQNPEQIKSMLIGSETRLVHLYTGNNGERPDRKQCARQLTAGCKVEISAASGGENRAPTHVENIQILNVILHMYKKIFNKAQ